MRAGATQRPTKSTPIVSLTIGGDVYYNETDNPLHNKRILSVETNENIWGSSYKVLLDNADETLSVKDYQGSQAILYFGFAEEAGSSYPAYWVESQRQVSQDGKLSMELVCIDKMAILSQWKGISSGGYWNQPFQSPDYLDETVLPISGEPIPDDLKDKLSDHYNKTIQEIVTGTLSNAGMQVVWDDIALDDALTQDKPPVSAPDIRSMLYQAMSLSKSYLRWQADGKFHQITPEAHDSAYSYDEKLYHYNTVEEKLLAVPNRVRVWYIDKTDPEPENWTWEESDWSNGHGVDSTSYNKLGHYIDEHHNLEWDYIETIQTEEEANRRADSRIAKIQMSVATGQLVAPMHCSQELFDAITIYDDRYVGNKMITGYVFGISRQYSAGVYRIALQLGGVETAYTPQGGLDISVTKPPVPSPQKETPIPEFPEIHWEDILPKAVQGYTHNITFTATSRTNVTWSAGTIKFYDGTTQAINAGSYNIPTDDIYYIYFNLASFPATLKTCKANDYMGNYLSDKTSVLCVIQRGSATNIFARVIPGWEKQPLITADMIQMAGLKEWQDPNTGFRYQQISDTQISSGFIKLTSQTQYADNTLDPTKKNKIFYAQPTPPYNVGDVWVADTVVKYCTNARTSGSYVAGDWSDSTRTMVSNTDIQAGHIKLSTTVKDGEWYNNSGVLIDATKGIRLYGSDMAFATYSSEYNARNDLFRQTYMNSSGEITAGAGNVVLNSSGITIYGNQIMSFHYGSPGSSYNTGWLYATQGTYEGNTEYATGIYGNTNYSLVLKQNGTRGRVLLEAAHNIDFNTNNKINFQYSASTKIEMTSTHLNFTSITADLYNATGFVLPFSSPKKAGSMYCLGGHIYFYNGSDWKQLAEVP